MTDRELLEDAAKAACFYFNPTMTDEHGLWGCFEDEPQKTYPWNPLTDDGDRYRLARKCKLIVDFDGGEVKWQFDGEEYKRRFQFTPGNNAEEAYAIVRAAAEIGRAMK